MPYVPTWKERLEDAKPYAMPAVAVAIVLAVGGWVAWHQFGPRPAEENAPPTAKDAAARMTELQGAGALVDGLEKSYLKALESGAAAEAATLLNRTIAKQREALRLDPGVNAAQTARLARLEAARDKLMSRAAAAESQELEREAMTAQQAGHNAGVVDKLREALRLQREGNARAGAADAQDFAREAQLTQAIERAESEPLHTAVETALTLAHSAATQENWDEALKAFNDARAAQVEINQRFPGGPFTDLAALDRIDGEIASLRAAGLAATTGAREREADAAAKAGRAQESAALYAAAAELQRQLNEKYARSRFASSARVDELTTKHDTMLSGTLLARATALDGEIAAALARRQVVAAGEEIAAAAELVDQAAKNFPRSRVLDPALAAKLAFFNQHRGDLATLQAAIYARLVPLPGDGKIRLLKTEVPQDLFARVMGENPSRHAGGALPVDSVSWVEAQEFCRRLGWLLGAKVRLPSEAEFRTAAGAAENSAAGATAVAWSAETSKGQTHDTGTSSATGAGFFDVVGNVAEWLQPADDTSETAPVAGGSYLDPTSALTPLPLVSMDKHERARHIGFRVAVELATP